MHMNISGLRKSVLDMEDSMVESLCTMLRIKAVGPENGGQGEAERGKYLYALAKSMGFKFVEILESRDQSVPTGRRPNLIIRVKGSGPKNMWVVTHMDTVPEGDSSAWNTLPFDPTIVDGKIFGRGSEDNGQELIASLYGLKALIEAGVTPECNIGLVFVSDEEHGNTHGIDFLLKKDIFKKGDIAVVPDHGQPDGGAICVVEKGIAWVDVEVVGRQTHGSTPDEGINAFEVGSRFMLEVMGQLRKRFDGLDPMFEPPQSTFSPTKCYANGPNVNTIPGRHQFAFDFRVLPNYGLDDVMAALRETADKVEKSTGAKIKLSFLQRADAAPGTSTDSEIVTRLSDAIRKVRGVVPHPIGIGGGTCAAPFRRHGIDAAVWSTISETAHDANEFSKISDLVADAQVYALLFAGKNISED